MKMQLVDEIECYGELMETSNFEIVCEDEENDTIWTDGNISTESGIFNSWEEVAAVLTDNVEGNILEIVAC